MYMYYSVLVDLKIIPCTICECINVYNLLERDSCLMRPVTVGTTTTTMGSRRSRN